MPERCPAAGPLQAVAWARILPRGPEQPPHHLEGPARRVRPPSIPCCPSLPRPPGVRAPARPGVRVAGLRASASLGLRVLRLLQAQTRLRVQS